MKGSAAITLIIILLVVMIVVMVIGFGFINVSTGDYFKPEVRDCTNATTYTYKCNFFGCHEECS